MFRLAIVAASLLVGAASPIVADFHADPGRTAAYVMPGLDRAHAARLRRDPDFHGIVDGNVLAQPLFWQSAAHPKGLVIVATEQNHLTALDPASGEPVWDRVLGEPVPQTALPCGNIFPTGVTGGPVIDPASGTVYLAAQIEQAAGPSILAFAVGLDDGQLRPGWPLDIAAGLAAAGRPFDVLHQGQRGALALRGTTLYVPFGGRSGDCTPYRGWVIGIDVAAPRIAGAFETPGVGGGIWSVGGVVQAGGALFVSTGNTFGARDWAGGEAVLRLDPDHLARPADGFVAANWRALDATDLDLGGSNPVALDVAGRRLLVALGKDSRAYLLDRDRLGGIGGALAVRTVSLDQMRNAAAAWTSGAAGYVAIARRGSDCPRDRLGVTTLRLRPSPASIETAWCAALRGSGSPITTTTDGHAERVLWVIGADGDDRLHGFDAATGEIVFAGGGEAEHMSGLHYTTTILAAAGRLYVGAAGRIYAFRF